jgi:hypothetical protein
MAQETRLLGNGHAHTTIEKLLIAAFYVTGINYVNGILAHFPYFENKKYSYEMSLLCVCVCVCVCVFICSPHYYLLNDRTDLYETWYVYHAT